MTNEEINGALISFCISGEFPSVANLREHWTKKAKRTRTQRNTTRLGWLTRSVAHRTEAQLRTLGGFPTRVTLIRVAPRALDSDNLASALKACRDEVAQLLNVNDSPSSCVSWAYEQRKPMLKGGAPGVLVVVSAASISERQTCPTCGAVK